MKKSETLSHLIASKVEKSLKDMITKECEKQDRSESYVVRKIVKQHFEDKHAIKQNKK